LLDDAVAAFLDSVPERALDEPLLALLRAQGFSDVHLTHGQEEFGKDIVARRDGEQWVFQSKAGNIGQPQWRSLLGQLDELRLSDYAGPELDTTLPRRAVLVTTGRMVGNAPLLASEYNKRAEQRGEPKLEIWAKDHLLAALGGNPDAVLRGSIDGALLTVLGAIDRRDLSMDDIEQFSRRWDAFPPDKLLGLGVIEAALVCNRLKDTDRLDLACHLALCLVRAAWAGARDDADAAIAADAGGMLFETFALQLWAECDERLLRRRGVVAYSVATSIGFAAWATYPVRCMRIAELLGLLGLRVRERDPTLAAAVATWLAKFTTAQPGVSHPIGDRYAVCIIPAALLLSAHRPASARRLLTKTTVWLCDHHERWSFGLAPAGAPPASEIGRIFGDVFEHIPMRKRRISQVAGVLLDMAALLGYRKVYADIRNDQLSVRLSPIVLRCRDDADQYSLTALGNRWDINPDYPDELPRKGPLETSHHREGSASRHLVHEGRPWDLLATSSALRDRHFVPAIRALTASTQ
jgi:hypothetical protein